MVGVPVQKFLSRSFSKPFSLNALFRKELYMVNAEVVHNIMVTFSAPTACTVQILKTSRTAQFIIVTANGSNAGS